MWEVLVIKSNTGLTYTAYIQRLRIEESAFLLISTDLSIHAIIEKIGLKNKEYFYRIFKETYQTTPLQYRRDNQIKHIL